MTPAPEDRGFPARRKRPPVLVGLGSNLPHPRIGPPLRVCEAALEALARRGAPAVRRSGWYRSAPLPPSGQPDFVNGVAAVSTSLGPERLLAVLHEIEAGFGRERPAPGAARVLDLDLLAYGDVVRGDGAPPFLPHPRMAARAFVLLPLRDVVPGWRHPADGRGIGDLVAALPSGQRCALLPGRPEDLGEPA